jgi:glycosyltransferase involved in cell wall biosynthesis
VLRQRFAGIGPGDRVVIWGGGVYDWFDPLSLVRAVDRVRVTVPDIRVVFLGMRNPNPGIAEMGVAVALRQLSADLGLTGSHVFFNEEWVPYDERGAYLLDADVAVSTHLDHVETRFSFRTRVLDYLWAGRPMVLTSGDALSDLVAHEGLGVTVPAGDVDSLADALARLLTEGLPDADFGAVAARFRWPIVAGPLVAWCAEPHRAPDRPLLDRVGRGPTELHPAGRQR